MKQNITLIINKQVEKINQQKPNIQFCLAFYEKCNKYKFQGLDQYSPLELLLISYTSIEFIDIEFTYAIITIT